MSQCYCYAIPYELMNGWRSYCLHAGHHYVYTFEPFYYIRWRRRHVNIGARRRYMINICCYYAPSFGNSYFILLIRHVMNVGRHWRWQPINELLSYWLYAIPLYIGLERQSDDMLHAGLRSYVPRLFWQHVDSVNVTTAKSNIWRRRVMTTMVGYARQRRQADVTVKNI